MASKRRFAIASLAALLLCPAVLAASDPGPICMPACTGNPHVDAAAAAVSASVSFLLSDPGPLCQPAC